MTITYRPIEKWPREFTKGRRRSPFKAAYASTMNLLERELRHAGARSAVVQLAVSPDQFRIIDGKPYANATPAHPGVIVSFDKGKIPLAFPCDTYVTWVENLRAIGLALDALRRVDRYGVTKHAEQYRGWNALPPGRGPLVTPTMTVEEAAAWISGRQGAGIPTAAEDLIASPEEVTRAYRVSAALFHPDFNGNVERPEWHQLQAAKAVLDAHHGS